MPIIPPIQNNLSPSTDQLETTPGLINSFPFTGLDVEDLTSLTNVENNPLDSPKPGSDNHLGGFKPKYSPKKTYMDSIQGSERSPESAAQFNNFKTSGLDLESDIAGVRQGGSGGPNRTNSIQSKNSFQSGQYTTIRAGGPGYKGSNAGGEVIKQTLHQYTPQSTYLDNSPIQTSSNFTPKNNTTTEGGANGFDATLK